MRNSAHRIYQLTIRGTFHEVPAGSCLEDLHQVRILRMHREDQDLGARLLRHKLFRRW